MVERCGHLGGWRVYAVPPSTGRQRALLGVEDGGFTTSKGVVIGTHAANVFGDHGCKSPFRGGCLASRYSLQIARKKERAEGGERSVHVAMCTASPKTVDPRIPTMPGRSMSGFYRSGRHCLHQARSSMRCSASRMKGGLLPTKNHQAQREPARGGDIDCDVSP